MEVYGEKPKRFTAEWWDYMWYYYKWHVIVTIAGITLAAVSLVQCANKPVYDLEVTIVTKNALALSQTDRLEEYVRDTVDDASGNGKKEVSVTSIYVDGESAEYEQAMFNKLMIELSMPESYVFIMTREIADRAIEYGILEKTEDWAGDAESDGYVVSLKGNEKLKAALIDSDNEELYIGVCSLFDDKKDDELERKRYENGIKLAQDIIGLE